MRKPNSPYNFQRTDVAEPTDKLVSAGQKLAKHIKHEDIAYFEPIKRPVEPILNIRNSLLVPELLTIKRQRMSESAFAFFRGTVDLMNHDLAKLKTSGVKVLLDGDAHLGNFGFYGSPEGQLLFDMNDFDEARIGHWETDLRRFLVSCLLVAEQHAFDKKDVDHFLANAIDTYANSLSHMNALSPLVKFTLPSTLENIIQIFGQLDGTPDHFETSFDKLIRKSIKKALRSDSNFAVKKYTEINNAGRRQFKENAPITTHISHTDYQQLVAGYLTYRAHTRCDAQLFLEDFHIVDIVRHTVGVGSVGTLCYLMLLEDADNNYLVLQIKQALPIYQGAEIYKSHHHTQGQNIVDSQLILQSASDPFLGYLDTDYGSFYVRQFKDMKGSINLDKLDWSAYKDYVLVCITLMARAHSQSPNSPMIVGFLGAKGWLPEAFITFSRNYLKQVHYDYQTFMHED